MATATEKLYELSFLASSELDEAGIAALRNELDTMAVKLGGSVREHGHAEKRKLAYPVKKARNAYLVSEQLMLTPETKNALAKELRLHKNILRHMFIATTEKFIKRLHERRVAELQTLTREGVKEKTAPVIKRPTHTAKPVEEKKVDIAEIERKLDEILGREF